MKRLIILLFIPAACLGQKDSTHVFINGKYIAVAVDQGEMIHQGVYNLVKLHLQGTQAIQFDSSKIYYERQKKFTKLYNKAKMDFDKQPSQKKLDILCKYSDSAASYKTLLDKLKK